MIKTYPFRIMDERMYVIRDEGCDEAVIIDPFEDDEAFSDLKGCRKVYVLLTHHHFDHISGVNALKNQFNCKVICTTACSKIICTDDNGSRRFPFLFLSNKETFYYIRDHFEFPYYCSADTTFDGEFCLEVSGHSYHLIEMPGHTRSSMMIMLDDEYMFAGDNVIGNGQELVFHDACKEEYWSRVLPFLESYECTDVKIMPGHGEAGSVSHFLKLIRNYKRD